MLEIGLDSPWYLFLLLVIPVIWIFSLQSLAGWGRFRRLVALTLRSFVIILVILALAEAQWKQTSDRITVLFLLDQSLSIPENQRQAMLKYVVDEVQKHRNITRRDRAGVIVFGREAAIEVPPFDDQIQVHHVESLLEVRQDATDLSAALQLAQATFPEDAAKRIVIVTDGNENLGNASEVAGIMAQNGVSIYVVPVTVHQQAEVAVEKVAIPTEVDKSQPFDVRIVLNNLTQAAAEDSKEVSGKLQLIRRTGRQSNTIEQPIVLAPGKQVFKLTQIIDKSDFYTYEAHFIPDPSSDDFLPQNNQATAFTHVQGQGHILLIEDWEHPGEFDFLVSRLKAMNLEVTVQKSNELFTSLAELQRYDTVVMANVPRSNSPTGGFSDTQIEMLVSNVQRMGCGLVMLGGPRSFGAGGWTNTRLEEALPVDFQIKNSKVVPAGALVMTMHASEMNKGNHWQKVIAREALNTLGSQDYCGVVHWAEGTDKWLWNPPNGLSQVAGQRKSMLARLDRMRPGDMPEFDPSMKMAAAAFARLPDETVRHMIIISDGDPSKPRPNTIAELKRLKVRVTTVAVGTHGEPGSSLLQNISNQTNGNYYVVTNPKTLPRIYQVEARRVARPLVKEVTVEPRIVHPHEMLNGINEPLPPITGFVVTTVKENPLVEVSMISPVPSGRRNSTILASWTYDLGRTVAFTTDAGQRWANAWTTWEQYDKLFSQMIRWSMRPTGNLGKFTIATDVRDDNVHVVLTALDENDEFLNFLNISTSVLDPHMKSTAISIRQTAPGRYEGEFQATLAGNYFLTVLPGPGRAPIRTGVNIPYSREFTDQESNEVLLKNLAALTPAAGQPGKLIRGKLVSKEMHDLLSVDTFDHNLPKAVTRSAIWPTLMVLATCIFVLDVFTRRVHVHLAWIAPLLATTRNWLLRRPPETNPDSRIERLRSRKQAIHEQLDQKRTTVRYDGATETGQTMDVLQEGSGHEPSIPHPTSPETPPTEPVDEEDNNDYTSRLLKAKKDVWKKKT